MTSPFPPQSPQRKESFKDFSRFPCGEQSESDAPRARRPLESSASRADLRNHQMQPSRTRPLRLRRGSGFYSIRQRQGVAFVSIALRAGARTIDNCAVIALAIAIRL
jgi:hypothetical protein